MEALQVAAVAGPLIGVIVGAGLTAWLGSRQEARRWRRDWLTARVSETRGVLADVLVAVNKQIIVTGQCADAVLGQRPVVPTERVRAVDEMWQTVQARGGVLAPNGVQHAITAFDRARAAMVEAVNGRQPDAIGGARVDLDRARVWVLDAAQAAINDLNDALSPHMESRPARAFRWLRRQPSPYLAPMPSEMSAAAGGHRPPRA